MNGSYLNARGPTERIAVAFKSCLELWFHDNPTHRYAGIIPTYGYFEKFIDSFVMWERAEAALAERPNQDDARSSELKGIMHEASDKIANILKILKET